MSKKIILSSVFVFLLISVNSSARAKGPEGKHFGFGHMFGHGSARSKEQHVTNFFHPTGQARATTEHIDNSLFKGVFHGHGPNH